MLDLARFEIKHNPETQKASVNVPNDTTIRSKQSLSNYFSNDRLNETFKNKSFTFLSTNVPPNPDETPFITYIEKNNSRLFPYSTMVTDALTRIFPQVFFRFGRHETPQVRCISFDKNNPKKPCKKGEIPNTLVLVLPFDSTVIGVSPFAVIIRCTDGTQHLATLFNLVLSGVVSENSVFALRPIIENPSHIVSTLDDSNSSPKTYGDYRFASDHSAKYYAKSHNCNKVTDLIAIEHASAFGWVFPKAPKNYIDSVYAFLDFEPHPTLQLVLELKEKAAEKLCNSAIVEVGSDLLLIRQAGTVFLIDKEGNAFVGDPTLDYHISNKNGLEFVVNKSYKIQSLTAKYDSEVNTREALQEEAAQYFSKRHPNYEYLNTSPFFHEIIKTNFNITAIGKFFDFLRTHVHDRKAVKAINSVRYTPPKIEKKFLIFDTSIVFFDGHTTIMLAHNGAVAITFGRGHRERYYITPSGGLSWLYVRGG